MVNIEDLKIGSTIYKVWDAYECNAGLEGIHPDDCGVYITKETVSIIGKSELGLFFVCVGEEDRQFNDVFRVKDYFDTFYYLTYEEALETATSQLKLHYLRDRAEGD